MENLPKKQIGLIGLGRMGAALAQNLISNSWEVAGLDKDPQKTKELEPKGVKAFYSTAELVKYLDKPRVLWLMVNAGEPVQEVMFGKDGLINHLDPGDIVIDGGNSYFEDSIAASYVFNEKNISFLDVGVANGPEGAQFGACLMIGGQRPVYSHLEELFKTLSVENGYRYVGNTGSGHFVKMVHNAVEYGFVQAIAEGFDVLKNNGRFEFNLKQIAELYNSGSLLESKLMDCTAKAFDEFGDGLGEIKGIAAQSGEGKWTSNFARTLGMALPAIEASINAREKSAEKPNFQAKIVMAIRNVFGGHPLNP